MIPLVQMCFDEVQLKWLNPSTCTIKTMFKWSSTVLSQRNHALSYGRCIIPLYTAWEKVEETNLSYTTVSSNINIETSHNHQLCLQLFCNQSNHSVFKKTTLSELTSYNQLNSVIIMSVLFTYITYSPDECLQNLKPQSTSSMIANATMLIKPTLTPITTFPTKLIPFIMR